MRVSKVFALIAGAMSIASVHAAELEQSDLTKKFQSIVPFSVKAVEDAPMKGFKQFVTAEGVFYLSNDGEYLISGSVHKATRDLPNLTKDRLGQEHKVAINELKDSFLTFKAENQKHEIVVFYDSSCPYCRKLHQEVPALLAQGVTVHYAGWPRMGVRNPQDQMTFTSGYRDLESIWCATSPQEAMNKSADGVHVPSASCDTKIEEHFKLGEQMGVRGTPAIYDVNGREVARGWAPAPQLMKNIKALN
jgi:thiol:disulfide interchange protein DsbC